MVSDDNDDKNMMLHVQIVAFTCANHLDMRVMMCRR